MADLSLSQQLELLVTSQLHNSQQHLQQIELLNTTMAHSKLLLDEMLVEYDRKRPGKPFHLE